MMKRTRTVLVVLSMLLCGITSATAQVSIGIGTPHVSIGVNLPVYPELVPVPNYPVYYAPRLGANYFFYDGMYWVYEAGNWHASAWYNGPWSVVHRDVVPAYILRVPVRYYRVPPPYFAGWRVDAAPLWGVHWGNTWAVSRAGWDRWDRTVVVARAPLPVYQRAYVGARYPTVVNQTNIHINNYNYHPREAAVRAHYKERVAKAPPDVQRRFAEREAAQVRKESAGKSAKDYAPGQVKRQEGAKSAKEYAPGQVKREEGAKSAKEYAPGQQAKDQGQGGKSDNKGNQGGKPADTKGNQGGKPADTKGNQGGKPADTKSGQGGKPTDTKGGKPDEKGKEGKGGGKG